MGGLFPNGARLSESCPINNQPAGTFYLQVPDRPCYRRETPSQLKSSSLTEAKKRNSVFRGWSWKLFQTVENFCVLLLPSVHVMQKREKGTCEGEEGVIHAENKLTCCPWTDFIHLFKILHVLSPGLRTIMVGHVQPRAGSQPICWELHGSLRRTCTHAWRNTPLKPLSLAINDIILICHTTVN